MVGIPLHVFLSTCDDEQKQSGFGFLDGMIVLESGCDTETTLASCADNTTRSCVKL